MKGGEGWVSGKEYNEKCAMIKDLKEKLDNMQRRFNSLA